MGIIQRLRGKSVFAKVTTASFAASSTSVASGTLTVNGTAEVTVAHGLAVTPKFVSVYTMTGSFVPICTTVNATNLVLTASGSTNLGWSAW